DIIGTIGADHPLVLVINTPKVLKKQIGMEVQGAPQQWVARAFPNLDLDNFYWQILDSKGFRVVSMAKKPEIDGLLEELKGLGIVPTGISLGISGLRHSLPFLEQPVHGSNFMIAPDERGRPVLGSGDSPTAGPLHLQGLVLSKTNL